MPAPLTPAQARVLDYVTGVVVERGGFPSGPRIARRLGFRNSATAYEHLERLAAKGYLTVSRSEGGGWRRYHLSERALARAGTVLPRLGRIPAGPLTDIDADLDSVVSGVEDILPARAGDYLLEVDGDSMEGAGLLPGMLLLIRPEAEPAPGEICAVWVDGEGGTLKRVWVEGEEVRLVPENPAYTERRVPAESVRIQGVLIAALDVRRFR
jgi:repressor LexA